MRARALFLSGSGLVLLGLVAIGCVPPPQPPDPLLTCEELSATITNDPPATVDVQDTTATIQPGSGLTGCTDRTGAGITSAALSGTAQLVGVCSQHAQDTSWGTGTGQLEWSDGSTSAVSLEIVEEQGPRITLEVTSGRWKGATALVPVYLSAATGLCTGSGVSSQTLSSTAGFLSNGPFVLHPAGAPTKPQLRNVAAVAGGGFHTCSRMSDSTARCWGGNEFGQLGIGTFGTTPPLGSTIPVEVQGLTGVVRVATGSWHSCAITAGGGVQCWGRNDAGQLGDSTFSPRAAPVAVDGVSGATAIAAGDQHSCAVVAGGAVKCWGAGSAVPTAVPGISGATAISAGTHTCVLVAGGAAKCWGTNTYGELGDGTNVASAVPVDVVGVAGATAIGAGVGQSTCAVVAGGAVKCWGHNDWGQLGNGTTVDSNVPVDVAGLSGATGVGLGWGQSCAVLADGTARCWGRNEYGQLGDGTHTVRLTPVPVLGVGDAATLSAGHWSTCVTTVGGRARCWGSSDWGQLGSGSRASSSSPVPVVASL